MKPVPEIDLAELVEECIPIARREFAAKLRDGRVLASYCANEAQKAADLANLKRLADYLEKRYPSSPWMRP